MQNELNILLNEAKASILQAQDLKALDQIRVHYLGKKGQLTELLKNVGSLPPEQRPEIGKAVNIIKNQIVEILAQRDAALKAENISEQLAAQAIDVTLPGRGQNLGSIHPITRVRERVETLFSSMGFDIEEGPEIEDDYHNFEALNFSPLHPARNMHDTFYFEDGLLLRTHTSPVQIRVMQTSKPPLRVITPGRVYRCDSDQTHTPMFNQIEGLVVDETATFANLKGMLEDFLKKFFEREFSLRFRPSYFPFTEPSAEVDIKFSREADWLEVLGCGMIHPNVLNNVGIDSERFTGFAFGIGLDRLAMLLYGVDDLRIFFENDLKFLQQF